MLLINWSSPPRHALVKGFTQSIIYKKHVFFKYWGYLFDVVIFFILWLVLVIFNYSVIVINKTLELVLSSELEDDNHYITEGYIHELGDILEGNTSFVYVCVFLFRTLPIFVFRVWWSFFKALFSNLAKASCVWHLIRKKVQFISTLHFLLDYSWP